MTVDFIGHAFALHRRAFVSAECHAAMLSLPIISSKGPGAWLPHCIRAGSCLCVHAIASA